jgi:hypothetical protein
MLRIAGVAALLLLAACDGGGGTTGPVVGPPAAVTVTAGNGQAGAAGAALPADVEVRVTDADGDAVPAVPVTFFVTGGAGSFFVAVVNTDADGRASNRWTLGTAAGAQTAQARVVGAGGAFLAAPLTATAAPGAAAALEPVSPAHRTLPAGGDDSVTVRVRDALGNPVPGVAVVWSVTSGGGTVSAATRTTDAAGLAGTRWSPAVRLDSAQSLRASSGALQTAFTAQATMPTAILVSRVNDGQTGDVGTALPENVAVAVTLGDGRPLRGAAVSWSRTGPSVGGLFPPTATTDGAGRATAQWILDSRIGTQAATATVGPVATAFTATAVAGPPTRILVAAGQGQTGRPGRALPTPLGARLVDRYGNIVRGRDISWSVVTGGGSVAPAVSRPAPGAFDAETVWTLGPGIGAQTARASYGALTPVDFPATSRTVVLVTIETPEAGDTVGASVTVVASVDSDRPLSFVEAHITGLHPRAMAPTGDGRWTYTYDVSALPAGVLDLWVSARDVEGAYGSQHFAIYHDPSR